MLYTPQEPCEPGTPGKCPLSHDAVTHMPPGKYFIGDPGLVLDSLWDEVLEATQVFDQHRTSLAGFELWGARTAQSFKHVFTDQNDAEYYVYDGVLGCVPIELIEDPHGEDFGTVVDAPLGLEISVFKGVFRFGDIVINTNLPQEDSNNGHDLDPEDDRLVP